MKKSYIQVESELQHLYSKETNQYMHIYHETKLYLTSTRGGGVGGAKKSV